MIKIENVDVHGWEAAIRGMRNPMNSWEKSDSFPCDKYYDYNKGYCPECPVACKCDAIDNFRVGINDLKLMRNLAKAGPDHRKFLRMINVTCDITAPLYWWKEFDTYKVGTVTNSCSTMHKIHAKEFTLDDFSHEHLTDGGNYILNGTIDMLNDYRTQYLKTKDKEYWWQMIQFLPTSYNQKRTVQLNYQVLKNIYHARKEHKLDEWRYFCEWIETLPHSELITD